MKKYTKQDMLDALKKVADETSNIPSAKYFEENHIKPCSWTIKKHFGSWSNALKEVGFSRKRVHRYTDEELLDSIREKAEELQRIPKASELKLYYTIRNRFGTLKKAVKIAGLKYSKNLTTKRQILLEVKRRKLKVNSKTINNDSVFDIQKGVDFYFGNLPNLLNEINNERGFDLNEIHKSKIFCCFTMLKLLYFNRELSVYDIVNILNLSETKINKYVKQLNDVGFIIERDGENYRLIEIPFWLSNNPQRLTDD